jgi:hypothetical protein
MIRQVLMLSACGACLVACSSSEPDESTKPPAQGSLGSDQAEGPVRAEVADAPPLPAWWFDEPLWNDGRLSVCLQVTRETNVLAGEAVSQALYATIKEAFGEAPVDVGVTQDITLLEGGGVRIAALFDIAPTNAPNDHEDPDG